MNMRVMHRALNMPHMANMILIPYNVVIVVYPLSGMKNIRATIVMSDFVVTV